MLKLSYDRRLGQYRGDKGRIVNRTTVQKELKTFVQKTTREIELLTNKFNRGKISLEYLQISVAQILKDSTINLSLFAIGGKAQLDQFYNKNSFYGKIGNELKKQFESLQKQVLKIESGSYQGKPALLAYRMRQISKLPLVAYYQVEKYSKIEEGYNLAKRLLDPGANHCTKCPLYFTENYIPIAEIVPVGTECYCGGDCKCKVSYLKDFRRYVELAR